MFLRQSTKTSIVLGPFVDDADGKTAETGLTVGSIDVDLYKFSNTVPQAITTAITPNDGSDSDTGNDNDMDHIANGYYSLELSTGNTDTCGPLKITANISGALPVWADFHVLEEAIYDALFAASATGELLVDVAKISGDSTAADNMELMFDGTGYAGGTTKLSVNTTQIEGSDATDQINAACDASIVTYGLDHLVSASVAGADVTDNSIVAKLVSKESTADWDDFVNTTDSLQAQRDYTGSGYTAIPWNAAWDAEVQSECTDALTAYWTTAMSESYANLTPTTEPSPVEMLYMIFSCVSSFSISGATITSKQLNNSTAMTWTIDSATVPTSRTRAT